MALSKIRFDKTRVWIGFGCLTLVKLLIFLVLVHSGRVQPFVGDNASDHYIPAAKRLYSEGRFNGVDSRMDSKVAPGYSAVLAAVMHIDGKGFLVIAVCLQMLADLSTALALFWIGERFLTPAIGCLAGIAWLLFPPAVALSTWITAETFFCALLTVSAALMLSSMKPGQESCSLWAGAVLGCATLFRGTTLLLPLALMAVAVLQRRFKWSLCLGTGFVLVVAPWTIRNIVVLHDRIIVSVGLGSAIMQGSDERAYIIDDQHRHPGFSPMYAEAAKAGIIKPESDLESAIDNWSARVGLYNYWLRLVQRPGSLLTFFSQKFLRLWYSTESARLRTHLILAACSLPFVVPGLWQLWKWGRQRQALAAILNVTVLYFIVMHLLTGPLNRYMLPCYPLIILAACQRWAVISDRLSTHPVADSHAAAGAH